MKMLGREATMKVCKIHVFNDRVHRRIIQMYYDTEKNVSKYNKL